MDAGTRRRVGVVAAFARLSVCAAVIASVAGGPGGHKRATVTVRDANGTTLGTVNASVADTEAERYWGLSGTASLANGSGMWFVYAREGERAYVMRDVNYPLDIVFVGGDGRAPTEDPPYRRYAARARWILEVPAGWTTRHGVTAGDRVRARYP